MAERRMFAKTVINSARFLRMPPSSRLLYYDLGMAADDDGIVEAFTIMRTTGATEDDLRVLAAKGFVSILNEDFVAFITDWKRNNQIRPDRYKPSVYAELLVKIDDGIPTVNQMTTIGIPLVDEQETEVRLGKDSIVKGSVEGVQGEPAPMRKRFTPPTVNEVSEFARENGLDNVDPQRFVDFYASKGWVVGKAKMKDWKAACRNWNRNDRTKPGRVESDVADLDNLYA